MFDNTRTKKLSTVKFGYTILAFVEVEDAFAFINLINKAVQIEALGWKVEAEHEDITHVLSSSQSEGTLETLAYNKVDGRHTNEDLKAAQKAREDMEAGVREVPTVLDLPAPDAVEG